MSFSIPDFLIDRSVLPTYQIPKQEKIAKLEKVFNTCAPIAKTLKVELKYYKGHPVFRMPYQEKLNHSGGGIHGGLIAMMLDNAAWFAVAPYKDAWVATISLSVDYLRPAIQTDIYSIGYVTKLGGVSVSMANVFDQKGRLIAQGVGRFGASSAKGSYDFDEVWQKPADQRKMAKL